MLRHALFFLLIALAAPCVVAQATLGAPEERTFIAALDGTVQHYVLMRPADFDPAQSHDLMIALHGHGSDRWQFAQNDRGECRGARDVAAAHDMLFVSPDYRAKTSWMGPAAEVDMVQLIAALRSEFKIGRVLIMGGSMGGTSALIFTALHPELVQGVVALNPTANMLEYDQFQAHIRASYGGDPMAVPGEYHRRSAEYWPVAFTMPLAITTGGRDTIVPPDSALRLAGAVKRLNPHVLLLHRSETGHVTSYEDTVNSLEYVIARMAPAK